MKELSLNKNRFEGKTDFSQLPKSLSALNVASTRLEGEIRKDGLIVTATNSHVKVL
eukprot:CAMPEP_0201522624 /NCGR_PEP_ID=MMETSP0161_2-20130828/18398_1 /ASSEMBLY_ACC=CAM_ASM_000251 /TAXON_ID=180227 /ORGANISM="Neoparamoeba aestuarina, Strain SoJaBio B1-5/56/2" /LENGTH=55 /DNA_ID=CAMNT_0047921529 /DNA_START=153 /DNA_END=320 /DNA_ORIENTATION=-